MRNSGMKAAAIFQDLPPLAGRRNVSASEVMNLNELVNEYLDSPELKRLKSFHPRVKVDITATKLYCINSVVWIFNLTLNCGIKSTINNKFN